MVEHYLDMVVVTGSNPVKATIIKGFNRLNEILGVRTPMSIYDLATAKELGVEGAAILNDGSLDALNILRHSSAHLMAQAILVLYPDAQFFVGPVVDEGFYYDFKTAAKISEEDLKIIEKTMKKLAAQALPIEKYEVAKADAIARYSRDPLKSEVLSHISDEKVTFYKQGNFEDLCRGPHAPNTKFLANVKLTKLAGAYLGGDSSREMLTRIYGVAFSTEEALRAWETQMAEAAKRDHRKLGNELGLFKFSDEIGGGLAIWLPAGARLRAKLEAMSFKAHKRRGYQPVRGPEILRSDLWNKSGHIANYGENMYFTEIDEQQYGLKPMNCVGHIAVYQSQTRSFRDLPLKFFEFGTVHRHEQSGVLHGLLRVREFTQDDAHIFCREDQIAGEIEKILEFIDRLMSAFDFEYTLTLSTKPAKAIGEDRLWVKSTEEIESVLKKRGEYLIDEGGGAFYGPKIDVKITDAIGRKWQCGTVQVDMNLPERFDLCYTSSENQRVRPVMLHRAMMGSMERFIAILIEHYGGELPFCIAPTQVAIVPIAENHIEYAQEIADKLIEQEIDIELYDRDESLAKKIKNAEKTRVPYIVVIGDEELKTRSVALRDRRDRTQVTLPLDDFVKKCVEQNSKETF
ncbi:threonine--tRNA ligase [Campylobacterota bacterium]|nr:threonine--tRNA ligase [Campylobacterota bacterium]